MKNFYIYPIFILLLIQSCSSIKVEVAVADREIVKTNYEKIEKELLIGEMETQNRQLYNNYYDNYIDIFESRDITVSDIVKNKVKDVVNKVYEANLKNILTAKQSASNSIEYAKAKDDFFKNLENLKKDTDVALVVMKASNPEKSAEIVKAKKDIDIIVPSVQQRFSILGDINNSFITKNENNEILWKSTFNENYAKTNFGHSDVAIILRSTPKRDASNYVEKSGDYNNNFTIKGVRLDDTDVMKASADVLKQAINIFAASTAVVPIKLSTTVTGSNNAEQAATTTDLPMYNDYSVEKGKLEAKKYKLENIKKVFKNEIDLEKVKNMNDTELTTEIERVKILWSQFEKDL